MRLLKTIFTAACLTLFFSCIMSVSDESFASKMDIADSYIYQAEFDSAEKILLKALKIAHTDFHYIGIYRRLALMQKTKLCEDVLKKALKKSPQSIELNAVYTHFLMKQMRYDEALLIGEKLSGTFYGSLYAQARLFSMKQSKDYYASEHIPIYADAFNTTGNRSFIINAAVLKAMHGDYTGAMMYHPQKITPYDPAFFWASIAYDAGNYAVCLYDLSVVNQSVESELLKADAYVLSGEIERARDSWLWTLSFDDASPAAYLNAASSTERLGNFNEAGEYAKKLVTLYPAYVPGLVYYGYYALRQNEPNQDVLSLALEPTGLKSLKMQIAESYPKIPLSDALYRIDSVLVDNNDPYLQVERLKLAWANNKHIDIQEKVIDIWQLLENNMSTAYMYDEEIVQYAVWFFMSQAKYEEAESLFLPYLREKYGEKKWVTEESYEILFDPIIAKEKLAGWERDYLAYLNAVHIKNYQVVLDLLEYEYELHTIEDQGSSSSKKNEQMFMNLANIYEGLKYYDKATAVYSEISSITESAERKAEIHYRLACINIVKKEIKNAVLNLEYSLSLNPDNSKTRLLLKKIR